MDEPTPAQARLLDQLIGRARDLAKVFEAQFARSLTRTEDHCDQCFVLAVNERCPPIPPGFGCPILFQAESSESAYPVDIYLWHRRGLVTGIEIMALDGDAHPDLDELKVVEWSA